MINPSVMLFNGAIWRTSFLKHPIPYNKFKKGILEPVRPCPNYVSNHCNWSIQKYLTRFCVELNWLLHHQFDQYFCSTLFPFVVVASFQKRLLAGPTEKVGWLGIEAPHVMAKHCFVLISLFSNNIDLILDIGLFIVLCAFQWLTISSVWDQYIIKIKRCVISTV